MLSALCPLLVNGREIFIVVLGWLVGEWNYFDRLKLRVRLRAGDANVFRGRVLRHRIICDTPSAQRISIPHFEHTSVWTDAGLGYMVGEPEPLDRAMAGYPIPE